MSSRRVINLSEIIREYERLGEFFDTTVRLLNRMLPYLRIAIRIRREDGTVWAHVANSIVLEGGTIWISNIPAEEEESIEARPD